MTLQRSFDFRIPLIYLTGGLAAWAIPYLFATFRLKPADPWESFGQSLENLLIIYYSVLGFLVVAILSSGYGWYNSADLPRKKAFMAVCVVSIFLLGGLLITTISF